MLKRVCLDAASGVASVLAPADCRACGGPLLEARRFAVCGVCLGGLQEETSPVCGRCGERLEMDDLRGLGFSAAATQVCHACETAPPAFVSATAFAAYDGALRNLIRLHKFDGMETLDRPLGAKLAPLLRAAVAAFAEGPVHVIAVPLFGSRRRFNQSARIADAALRQMERSGAHTVVASHAALRRVRATESQSHLSPAQRRANVRGAFAVTQDVAGWQVVLVDDVYTTGATAAECTRRLLRAGAAAVRVATLARTQPHRVARWNGSAVAERFDPGCRSAIEAGNVVHFAGGGA